MQQDNLSLSLSSNVVGKERLVPVIALCIGFANRLDHRLVLFNFHHQSIDRVNVDFRFGDIIDIQKIWKLLATLKFGISS